MKEQVKKIRELYNINTDSVVIGSAQRNAFVGDGKYCPTLTEAMGMGGGQIPMVIDSCCVASRGRSPLNPSDRRSGINLEQRLEINTTNTCNCITNVCKDYYLLEKHGGTNMEIERVGQISNDGSQYGTVISDSGLSATLSAGTHGYANNCIATSNSVENYRIRKLTPREVFRLMDFTDDEFDNAASVSSNTALYKAAGNSIVVNCLVAILGQLLSGREDYYKNVDNFVERVDKIKDEDNKPERQN